MTNQRKNILLIGSGRFIANTVLPALSLLSDSYSIFGIVNRSGKLSNEIMQLNDELTCYNSLNAALSENKENIDVIFLCVPQAAVIHCLATLKKHKLTETPLFISTPVIPLSALKKVSLLKAFNACFAFEFIPHLRPYQIAKKLISENKIGRPIKCWLNHSGYLYHGLAAVKEILAAANLKTSKAIQYGCYNEYQLSFSNGTHGQITEPKDYAYGNMLIAGSTGLISDKNSDNQDTYTITTEVDSSGFVSGFTVNTSMNADELLSVSSYLQQLKTLHLPEKDTHRQLCIIAAADLFTGFINGESMPSCQRTIEEHLDMRLTKKLKRLGSISHFIKRLILGLFLK